MAFAHVMAQFSDLIGQIDYMEFTNRFLEPVETIGFNFVVLLTQLSQLLGLCLTSHINLFACIN